jgi:hypothetical protein
VQARGPAKPRSEKRPAPRLLQLTERGSRVEPPPHWAQGGPKTRKYSGIPVELSKLTERKCSTGGPGTPRSRKGDRSHEFANLKSGGAVWSRPLSGLKASTENPKKRWNYRGTYQTFRGEVSFGGPARPRSRKADRAHDFSNLQSGGVVWSRPLTGPRRAPKTRKYGEIPEALPKLAERNVQFRSGHAPVRKGDRSPRHLQLTERGSSEGRPVLSSRIGDITKNSES